MSSGTVTPRASHASISVIAPMSFWTSYPGVLIGVSLLTFFSSVLHVQLSNQTAVIGQHLHDAVCDPRGRGATGGLGPLAGARSERSRCQRLAADAPACS